MARQLPYLVFSFRAAAAQAAQLSGNDQEQFVKDLGEGFWCTPQPSTSQLQGQRIDARLLSRLFAAHTASIAAKRAWDRGACSNYGRLDDLLGRCGFPLLSEAEPDVYAHHAQQVALVAQRLGYRTIAF